MCGIAGGFGFTIADSDVAPLLKRMADRMVHRGPDEKGYYLAPELRAGLAVRRLSIIDLTTGSQPLLNEDGSIALAANGEIYNHKVLRQELIDRGHRFRSKSDCEVILHLYEDHGTDCLSHLNGMFGLALLDRKQRRLLLARDSIGMKPLYYSVTPHGLVFASEAKAIFACGFIPAEPDWEGLNVYFAGSYIPAPQTCFRHVHRLQPGEFLLAQDQHHTLERYWRLEFGRNGALRSEEEYAEELDYRLRKAVETHMSADVPVAAFVSGGWDSSLTALHASRQSSKPLKTFSLVFPEDPCADESRFSRLMAKTIASEHHEIEVRTARLPDIMYKVAESLEEPCATCPSPLIFQLAEAAAHEVKVAVSGEGSDELFAGYPWFRGEWIYTVRRFAPHALLRPIADRIAHPRWGRLLRMLAADSNGQADLEWLRGLTSWQARQLLNPELPLNGSPGIEAFAPPHETLATCTDRLQARIAIDLTRRLPDGLLLVNDKTSMAHSLELRMPFLDRNVVDFALQLPSNFKLRNGQEKYVLSRLAQDLPAEIRQRRKYGLQIPVKKPPRELQSFVRETLLRPSRMQLFQRRAVERRIAAVCDGRGNEWMPLWRLTIFALWWDQFIRT